MKDTLKQLINAVDEAKEKVAEAECERDEFLQPILSALGCGSPTSGGVSSCRIQGDTVHITKSGSTRGCTWDDDYEFPLDIFTSENPMSAAESYIAAKKKAQEDAERRKKLATIERLQKELIQP